MTDLGLIQKSIKPVGFSILKNTQTSTIITSMANPKLINSWKRNPNGIITKTTTRKIKASIRFRVAVN
jgi:hypothetical protein